MLGEQLGNAILESGGPAPNAPEPLPRGQQGKRSMMGVCGEKVDVLGFLKGVEEMSP